MADHTQRSPLSAGENSAATPAKTRTQTARAVAKTVRPPPPSEYERPKADRVDFMDMDYMALVLDDLRKGAQRK